VGEVGGRGRGEANGGNWKKNGIFGGGEEVREDRGVEVVEGCREWKGGEQGSGGSELAV